MIHHESSLSFLLLSLLVLLLMFRAACAHPLPTTEISDWDYAARENRESIMASDNSRLSKNLAGRNHDPRHGSGTIGTNVFGAADPGSPPATGIQKRSSTVVVDTEPHCILHHEYAEILRGQDVGLDPRARSFINRNNEVRYYICLPCRECPPGVRILSPCHRKMNTVCSTQCIDPGHVYDPEQQTCALRVVVTEANMTPSYASIAASSSQTSTVGRLFVLKDRTDENYIGDEVVGPLTTAYVPTHTAALWSQITVITVGVLCLNVVVIVGVVLAFKRTKCKKKWQRSCSGCINNALTPPQSCIPVAAGVLPSIHNQMDSKRDTTQGQGQSTGDLTLEPHQRAKESNLNVFHEPGHEQEMISISENEEPSPHHPPVQVLRCKDPFWLVMIGRFGPEGGVLSCEDSDVILEIPPGAIPAHHKDQLITAKISLRPDIAGPKLKDPDSELWLTPLVEFESPGLDYFLKDVRIRLPHRARMQPGWTFRVHHTNPTTATKSKEHADASPVSPNLEPRADTTLLGDADSKSAWFSVEQKCMLSKSGKGCRKSSTQAGEVTFTVDEKYINVSTPHFSKYICSGCHKEHPLHMEAAVYWNHIKVTGRQQMDLNVYIIDPIKDARKKVEENEGSGKHHYKTYPLILGYDTKPKVASSLEVSVEEGSMGEDWEWKLDTYGGCFEAKRVMPIQWVIRCCSAVVAAQQTFSFSPKTPIGSGPLSLFKAIICIKQQNSPRGNWKYIPVTVPLEKDVHSRKASNKGTDTVVTDEQIEIIVEQLDVKKWRPVYRKLMGDGADVRIQHIQAAQPNNTREQIHEALVDWRRSKGRQATLGALMVALEAVGERLMAESLEEVTGSGDDKVLISDDVNPPMRTVETPV